MLPMIGNRARCARLVSFLATHVGEGEGEGEGGEGGAARHLALADMCGKEADEPCATCAVPKYHR